MRPLCVLAVFLALGIAVQAFELRGKGGRRRDDDDDDDDDDDGNDMGDDDDDATMPGPGRKLKRKLMKLVGKMMSMACKFGKTFDVDDLLLEIGEKFMEGCPAPGTMEPFTGGPDPFTPEPFTGGPSPPEPFTGGPSPPDPSSMAPEPFTTPPSSDTPPIERELASELRRLLQLRQGRFGRKA